MVDPSEIANNLVSLLQDIPDLVAELDGDPGRISAYLDSYPRQSNLQLAIHEMPSPGVLVAWQSTGPGNFGGMTVWAHRFTIYLRSANVMPGSPGNYFSYFRLLTRGVPVSVGIPLMQVNVHPSCDPMDIPSIARNNDAEGLDYFEVAVSFTEIGDE
jgi:hypothetical protein